MNMNIPNQYPAIDHPSQERWWDATTHESEELRSRFMHTDENLAALSAAISRAALQSAMHRHTHELGNLSLLALTAKEQAEYRALAGVPSRAGEYIQWFGRKAMAAFARPDFNAKRPGVGLDLGGNSQHGNWEATAALDRLEHSLPSQLATAGVTDIRLLRDDHRLRSYLLTPMSEPGQEELGYAFIRRRRGVLDASIGHGARVKVYKQSLAVVALNQADYGLRGMIRGVFDMEGNFELQHNTPVAKAVGRLFEEAIHAPPGQTRNIVPVSAHLVMVASRQER